MVKEAYSGIKLWVRIIYSVTKEFVRVWRSDSRPVAATIELISKRKAEKIVQREFEEEILKKIATSAKNNKASKNN